MTSILKVDTIQDADGNNIINESSNTITIGASGDTTNIVGTLQNNGSAVGGTNTPAFMVKKNGSQSIANTTVTKITTWTEIYDTDSAFASDKFTPGVAGKYNFNLTVALDDVGDQKEFYLYIYKNGSGTGSATTRRRGSGTEKMTATMSWSDIANTTDYYEAYIYHNIGSSQNVRDDLSTIFSAFKIIE